MVEWRGGLWAWARGLKKMPTFRGGGAGLGDAMMPHLRKHALLPADAGQRSHSSVVRPSLPGLFLSPSSSSCTCAAFASQPRLDPSPHMSVSRGREREKAVCVPTRAAKRDATRHATPPLRYPSRRGRGLEVVVDGTGLDWTGLDWKDAQAQAWGGSARIHPFLPQADATRAAPEADANHPVHSSRVAALPWRGVGEDEAQSQPGQRRAEYVSGPCVDRYRPTGDGGKTCSPARRRPPDRRHLLPVSVFADAAQRRRLRPGPW